MLFSQLILRSPVIKSAFHINQYLSAPSGTTQQILDIDPMLSRVIFNRFY